MTGHDLREFIRVPFAAQTTVRTKDRSITSGSSLDISLNGLRIATDEPAPEVDTLCDVAVKLAGSEPPMTITARGALVRSAPGTIAVHFIEIDLDSYHHLQQLILSNTEHPERAEREFHAHRGIRGPAD